MTPSLHFVRYDLGVSQPARSGITGFPLPLNGAAGFKGEGWLDPELPHFSLRKDSVPRHPLRSGRPTSALMLIDIIRIGSSIIQREVLIRTQHEP